MTRTLVVRISWLWVYGQTGHSVSAGTTITFLHWQCQCLVIGGLAWLLVSRTDIFIYIPKMSMWLWIILKEPIVIFLESNLGQVPQQTLLFQSEQVLLCQACMPKSIPLQLTWLIRCTMHAVEYTYTSYAKARQREVHIDVGCHMYIAKHFQTGYICIKLGHVVCTARQTTVFNVELGRARTYTYVKKSISTAGGRPWE